MEAAPEIIGGDGGGESAGSYAMQTVLSDIHVAVISGYNNRAAAAIEYCR